MPIQNNSNLQLCTKISIVARKYKKNTPILQLYTKYSDPENLNTDVKIIYLQGCHVPFWDRVQGSSKLGKLSHFGKLGEIAHLLNEEQN